MTILNKILGAFYTPLSEDVMISFDRKGAATPEILPLLYSRLGVLPESKDSVTLNCERVKRLTGSDVLTCRPLYQEEISFETQSKIVLMTNNLPKFNAFDKAMTDRIKILPFNAEFTNNPKYVDKLKENINELFTYILQDSSSLWKQRNLGTIPRIMKEATEGYFKENDTIKMFIEDRCETGEDYKVGAKDVYDDYSNWCEMEKQKKVSKQYFAKVLESKFEKKKSNGNFYIGIKLNL
jgi:putative DNA primase/helicase